MTAKTNASRMLDKLRVPYTLHEYDWDENQLDAATVAGKVGIDCERLYKTLVLRGDKTGVIMACIPGHRELDLKRLAAASGNKKVEMTPVKDIAALTGYIRGGVSPLGVKKKYPLYIDRSVLPLDVVSISAGRRGLQIFLKGEDLVSACEGIVSDIVQ
ncbi:Cys-tRNA(Pro) deacylase [Paenibacillus doosanensis]|uniref:Cys-tRNA(Pro)/Cys-tRNA(Cys) deacylase n=1 Tax=Paenibacillus konkukensis TaxID=2020716 RepID=A0ABY4RT56_9BACL|nr:MULTISPECIES: Cys-tRNA(Pro) deacylase [Paenibacillus]MCS7463870.1 Cys-tRNA(Pro) deacylase [Paenibacillus doosanensis]UQZ85734.1 Cys-tRNA(Pro)/Cys-tRNA(Cys) deacylase YbaK [Paenibacillus konkukensis]